MESKYRNAPKRPKFLCAENLERRATLAGYRLQSAFDGRILASRVDRELCFYSRDVLRDVMAQTAAQAPQLASVIAGRVPSTDLWISVADKLVGERILWRNANGTYAFRFPILRKVFADLDNGCDSED